MKLADRHGFGFLQLVAEVACYRSSPGQIHGGNGPEFIATSVRPAT
jgi:hypothetical protein